MRATQQYATLTAVSRVWLHWVCHNTCGRLRRCRQLYCGVLDTRKLQVRLCEEALQKSAVRGGSYAHEGTRSTAAWRRAESAQCAQHHSAPALGCPRATGMARPRRLVAGITSHSTFVGLPVPTGCTCAKDSGLMGCLVCRRHASGIQKRRKGEIRGILARCSKLRMPSINCDHVLGVPTVGSPLNSEFPFPDSCCGPSRRPASAFAVSCFQVGFLHIVIRPPS